MKAAFFIFLAEETKDAIEQNEWKARYFAEQNLKQIIEAEREQKEVAERRDILEEKQRYKRLLRQKTVKKKNMKIHIGCGIIIRICLLHSKVNTYLNVRNQPTTDGTVLSESWTKYSAELVEDMETAGGT